MSAVGVIDIPVQDSPINHCNLLTFYGTQMQANKTAYPNKNKNH